MTNIQFAEMGSGGYWFHPAIMSTCILARRPKGKKATSYSVVKAHIETNMRPLLAMTGKQFAPSSKQVRKWKKEIPGHPEQASNLGKYKIGDLPTWARNELDWSVINQSVINQSTMNRGAMMSQAPSTEYARPMNPFPNPQVQHTCLGHMASSQADSSGSAGEVFIVVCVIAICWLSTRNRAVEEPARPVEPSPPSRRQEAPGDALACLRAARNFNLRSYKR